MGTKMVFKRYELKYLMTKKQRDSLLAVMEPYMSRDEFGHSSIRNIYFDTPDFRLIRHSLEKPVYKEKLRVRSYGRAGKTDPVFVELKKKYKSVVYKRRLSLSQAEADACLDRKSPLPDSQIGNEIGYTLQYYKHLSPAVFLSYEREAFYAKDGGDFRVTFDENIRFRETELTLDSDPWGTPILEPNQVLMELKTSGGLPLWMVQALSKEGILKTSFSKYGTAYQTIQMNQRKGVPLYA